MLIELLLIIVTENNNYLNLGLVDPLNVSNIRKDIG